MEDFADLTGVKAILWAGLPGQEAGNPLVDVLWGDVSPSGKLPYSIAKKTSDYGNSIQANTDSFKEGIWIDYRLLDKKKIEPRYEFGFGLCKCPVRMVTPSIAVPPLLLTPWQRIPHSTTPHSP